MDNVNVDFERAISRAYSEYAQDIIDISDGIDTNTLKTKDAISQLININSSVLATVLKQYNRELLNEI